MASKGNAISDSNLESVGGGKTVYTFDNGNVEGARFELVGADGAVIGRYISREERSKGIAAMDVDTVKPLSGWGQLNDLRSGKSL